MHDDIHPNQDQVGKGMFPSIIDQASEVQPIAIKTTNAKANTSVSQATNTSQDEKKSTGLVLFLWILGSLTFLVFLGFLFYFFVLPLIT